MAALDPQTEKEIREYEEMLKEQNTLYKSKFGNVRIDREHNTLFLGVEEGSYLMSTVFNPEISIEDNIKYAEDEFEDTMSVESYYDDTEDWEDEDYD